MKEKLLNNLSLKILSAVCAIIIWIGLLEYHTGFFTQQSDIYVGIVDVLVVNFDLTGNLYIVHEVIHTI